MTATIRALILASLGAGIVLGLLFPVQRSAALTSYKVDVYPGGNGYLSCGWHVACISPYTSGDALDFGDPTWVYFRSKSQNSEGSSVAGTGQGESPTGDRTNALTGPTSTSTMLTVRTGPKSSTSMSSRDTQAIAT